MYCQHSPWCNGLHVGFASNRSRVQIPTEQIFFHWEFKLQCKIFDITILFVILFLFFFKAVPTQSQPSIYPFFWCHIVLLFDKVANNGWFKVIKLVQNGKKIFKICSNGFKLVQLNSYLFKLVKTCSNRFKLVQKEPLYTCLGRIYLDQ